jgi:DNA-binding MarR family transcriptional regulator
MGAAVNQLVERALLRREPHPTSRRSMCLFATDEGRAASVRAEAAAQRIDAETTASLARTDLAELHRLLYRLVQGLNPDALLAEAAGDAEAESSV